VSDLDTRPAEHTLHCLETGGPEELLLSARRVYLGKTTEVARVLPDRQIRMVGAWCFLDHYGPEDVAGTPGMQVWAHPHTGLQTVSWLLEGEIEHRDSVGSLARVRPGELHVMTAGRGIVHSELSPVDKPPTMHGLHLWVALPADARDGLPRFDSYPDLPELRLDGGHGQVLVGEVAGVRSPAQGHSPLCAADLVLDAGADVTVALDPGFEHGVFVVEGEVTVESTATAVDQLLYLGTGRRSVRLRSAGGRVMLLGGEPFEEEIVMWWNFIGRSHAEVAAYRTAWADRAPRFPPVVDRSERVMEAPPMPTVALKPRPRRRATS
jgi:redox-sensitive bicupin YhaK (pirin superfamily)